MHSSLSCSLLPVIQKSLIFPLQHLTEILRYDMIFFQYLFFFTFGQKFKCVSKSSSSRLYVFEAAALFLLPPVTSAFWNLLNTQIAGCSMGVENTWSSSNLFSSYEEVLRARFFDSFPPPSNPPVLFKFREIFIAMTHYIIANQYIQEINTSLGKSFVIGNLSAIFPSSIMVNKISQLVKGSVW